MGLYDYRCMISGLSLKYSEQAVLIMVEKSSGDYKIFSLPISGSYNRLGTLDMVEEDLNTGLILSWFKQKLNEGKIEADWEEIRSVTRKENIESMNELLQAIERNVTMEYDCLKVDGIRLEYVLIDGHVFGAIAKNSRHIPVKASVFFKEIYRDRTRELEEKQKELQTFEDYMNENALHLQIPSGASQHYDDDVEAYITEAKQKFIKETNIYNAILNYESGFRKNA